MEHFRKLLPFLFLIISTPPTILAGDCSSSMKQQLLDKHNSYRGIHGVPPLDMNSEAAGVALEWANHLGSTKTFEHKQNNKFGENLWMMTSSGGSIDDGKAIKAVEGWYDEISLYSYYGSEPNMGSFHSYGHYTQLIWLDTRSVGFGCYNEGGRMVVVAEYSPHGNIIGTFAGQIFPPIE